MNVKGRGAGRQRNSGLPRGAAYRAVAEPANMNEGSSGPLPEYVMRIDFYGMAFETPRVTFHRWSPWRAAALEHRLFEAVRSLPRLESEAGADEWRLHIDDPRSWRGAVQAVARVLKGWQEEADPASERRSWRWLLEA